MINISIDVASAYFGFVCGSLFTLVVCFFVGWR